MLNLFWMKERNQYILIGNKLVANLMDMLKYLSHILQNYCQNHRVPKHFCFKKHLKEIIPQIYFSSQMIVYSIFKYLLTDTWAKSTGTTWWWKSTEESKTASHTYTKEKRCRLWHRWSKRLSAIGRKRGSASCSRGLVDLHITAFPCHKSAEQQGKVATGR